MTISFSCTLTELDIGGVGASSRGTIERLHAVPAAIRDYMIGPHRHFTTLVCLTLRRCKALRPITVPILAIHASLCLTLVPAYRRAGGGSRSSWRPGSHPMRLTPRSTPQLRLGTAQARQAPGALPLDQGFEPLPHQCSRFLQAADTLRLGEKIVVNVERGSNGPSLRMATCQYAANVPSSSGKH